MSDNEMGDLPVDGAQREVTDEQRVQAEAFSARVMEQIPSDVIDDVKARASAITKEAERRSAAEAAQLCVENTKHDPLIPIVVDAMNGGDHRLIAGLIATALMNSLSINGAHDTVVANVKTLDGLCKHNFKTIQEDFTAMQQKIIQPLYLAVSELYNLTGHPIPGYILPKHKADVKAKKPQQA